VSGVANVALPKDNVVTAEWTAWEARMKLVVPTTLYQTWLGAANRMLVQPQKVIIIHKRQRIWRPNSQ